MLKERIRVSSGFFYVIRDMAGDEKKLFYKFFSLENDMEDLSGLVPLRYWEPNNEEDTRIPVEKGCFVLLVEKEDKRVVERSWFYSSDEVQKGELAIVVKKNKKYGKNAYMITVEWTKEEDPVAINSRYIFLKNRLRKEKYYFLTDQIFPLNPYGKKRIDQYVFELPENESLDDYMICVEPLVRERYSISIDM